MAVEFDLPEGFQLPENAEPGQTFDAVASLKMSDDGQVQLVAIDGIPLQGVDKGNDNDADDQPQQTNGAAESQNSGNSFLHAMS